MRSDHEVLVVGAGPVGLTAAHELARRGIRVRVVDKATGPATASRAMATHARTLEICRQMGVLDDLLPRGRKVEHFTIHLRGRTLVRFDTDYSKLPTRYPFSLMVDQVVTESVLRDSLSALGVRVEWGIELVSCVSREDGADAELRPVGGQVERHHYSWLVGADGAHSRVRKCLGLRLLGDSTKTWLNADIQLPLDLPADSNHLVHHGRGTLLLVPFPQPGKWRVVDTEDTDHVDDIDLVTDRLADKLSRGFARAVAIPEPSWVSAFTVQQRMIEKMRAGRCFVAGDAAHVHSPASGQGMNTGIQDAFNLSWKLADVLRGHAGEALLDSYEAERVPIGRALLRSTRTATALVSLRNAIAPVAMPAGLGLVRTVPALKRRLEAKLIRGFCGLALSYPDSPLSVPALGSGPAPGDRLLLPFDLFDGRWVLLVFSDDNKLAGSGIRARYGHVVDLRAAGDPGLAGVSRGGYALVRPDGHLAAKGDRTDETVLEQLFSRLHLLPDHGVRKE